jgi:hypothetical protein
MELIWHHCQTGPRFELLTTSPTQVELEYMSCYPFLIHQKTYDLATQYLTRLQQGHPSGQYLRDDISSQSIDTWTVDHFLEALINTKRPQIFAESAVCGDGSDWTLDELSILGDIGVAVPVNIFDNGRHRQPDVHKPPLKGTLLFVPGALLRNGRNFTPADWNTVVKEGKIDFDGYFSLYERRLLPLFWYADGKAKECGQKAFITIPGLGCGQFSGPFAGQLGQYLNRALQRFLETHASKFNHIRAVYFDPFNECNNERAQIHGVDYFVRPLTKGYSGKPQLCTPITYEEDGDGFSNCCLFSIVAWDHVSWPGNDFYIGSRATDDGVKAAATDTMSVITNVSGVYNSNSFCYLPPSGFDTWEQVVKDKHIHLKLHENLSIFEE